MPNNFIITRIPDFNAGVSNRRINPLNAPENSVSLGENVDLSQGGMKVRQGYTLGHNATELVGEVRAVKQVVLPTNEQTYTIAQVAGSAATTWEQVTDGPLLSEHTIVFDTQNGRHLLFGGCDNLGAYSDVVYECPAGGGTWTVVTTSGVGPSARAGHVAVYNPGDNCMYVHGGFEAGPTAVNDMFKLDCDTDAWSEVTLSGTPPAVRGYHAGCLIGTTVLSVCGGVKYGPSVYYSASTYYNITLSTGVCAEVVGGGVGPSAREGHTFVYDGSANCYVIGGDVNGEFTTPTCYKLVRGTATWSAIASMPLAIGLAWHQSWYCSGYVITVGGRGAIVYTYSDAYQVYKISNNTWISAQPTGDIGARESFGLSVEDDGTILVHGGTDADGATIDTTYVSSKLCSDSVATGVLATYGLFASATQIPNTSMVFEPIYDLESTSGVCEIETLGDRVIVTEGKTDVPLVVVPGLLSTDPVTSWGCPMRVLLTYDGVNYHDISDKVLDNDTDSYADIGGITTRGAVIIICDVPTVYGFYLKFETVNNASGTISEFSDDVLFDSTADIAREDVGNGIERWVKNGDKIGHFEGPAKAISGAAVDNSGNLAGTMSLPIVGHGQVVGNVVEIRNTVAYNGTYTLGAQTGGDADHLIVVHANTAEVFANPDDEMRQRFTVGAGNNAPLVETGVTVKFSDASPTLTTITDDGEQDSECTISVDHATGDVDIYGIVINDSDVATVSTSTDVPTSLVTYTKNASTWKSNISLRQVVKAADYSVTSSFIRVKIESGNTYSTVNDGTHILGASIVERSGATANGTTTPTRLTFNNGSNTVDIPRTYPDYSTSVSYTVNTKCTYSGAIYICIANTSGAWDGAKWTATGEPLGYVYSDIITFAFDETKDYLISIDIDTGTGSPVAGSGGTWGYGGGTGTSTGTAANWSNICVTTKPIGDTHLYYNYAGQETCMTQTPSGTVTTNYGIIGVTELQGYGALTPVTSMHVATSTDTSQLDTTGVDSFKSISVTAATPGSSKCYAALSVDQRNTFFIYTGAAIRTIVKFDSVWQYQDAADAWQSATTNTLLGALRQAFAIAKNQMTPTALNAYTSSAWTTVAGYPTLDFAFALQANANDLPTLTKFSVTIYDSGGADVKGWVAGDWSAGAAGWTDGTVSGGVSFGQNGSITYDGATGFTADYGVIAGIPGYAYKANCRGTSVGTTLTKVRFRAPVQPLQSIGSGRPDTVTGFVVHNGSTGAVRDYAVEVSDETYTSFASATVALATDDALYVGYLTPFTSLELIPGDTVNAVVSTLSGKYWNGAAWVALTISDGTSDSGKTFATRGRIEWTVPDDWKQNIPLPGLQYVDEFGNRMVLCYWLKFTVDTALTAGTLIAEAKVFPVPNELVKYKHVGILQNRVVLGNRPDAPDQIAVSAPFAEYVWTGPYAANYRLGGGSILALISAWNTILAGQNQRFTMIPQITGTEQDMIPVEAARHVPINRQSCVLAPMSGTDDGSRPGLFFLNRYGAYAVTGLQADSNYATARFQSLSEGVNWWESTGYPRIDLDYLHLACGEYWPARNWIIWSVPMIIDYPFDPGEAVVQSTTKVKIKATGHGRTAGDVINITGMTSYSGVHTLHADTDATWLVFTAGYTAETTTRLARYSVSGATQTTNNRLIIYDLSMGGWLPPFTIAAASLCTVYEYNANAPGKLGALRLFAGNYAGQILDLFDVSATTDNGTAISAFIDTQWMTHADPEHTPEWMKELREMWLFGTVDNNFYIDVQKDGGTTSLSTLTETALTDPTLYSFVKSFQHVDGGTIKANLFKYRFSFSGPADVQAVKVGIGYERNQLSTTS